MGDLLEFMEGNLYLYKAVCTRVVDGDTLELDIDLGLHCHRREKVRIAGIDTPEVYGVKKGSPEYEAGKKASARVHELLFTDAHSFVSQQLWIRSMRDKEGKYGRYVVDVYFQDDGEFVSLGSVLIEEGLAEAKEY